MRNQAKFQQDSGHHEKMFIKSLVMIDEDINNTAMQVIEENIMNNVMWIKKIDPIKAY